jgi:Ca-activated chloride channel family protein
MRIIVGVLVSGLGVALAGAGARAAGAQGIVLAGGVVRTSSVVRAELADRVVRYEVTETFRNNGPRLEEADYVFPLPANAAFEDCRLSINGELIAGEAMGAGEARAIYEEIVRKRRDPALIEWMGSGVLRARIFPLVPGEEKRVVVRFQSVAVREGDALAIGYARGAPPRQPAWPMPGPMPGPMPRPMMPVRPAVDGPRQSERTSESTNDSTSAWSFTLTYPATAGYGQATSPTHTLAVHRDGDRYTARATGDESAVTILVPVQPAGSAPAITVLPYAAGGEDGFAMITVTPPVAHVEAVPRDLTFVLDISGSMSGHKIEQARAAGRALLETLTPRDRFRLIDFSTDVHTYRDAWTVATRGAVDSAERYLGELSAGGSTNIDGALQAALEAPDPEASRLALVLFITDGMPTVGVSDPTVLAEHAANWRRGARLFTFGLGADVNASLLEQLALTGRGTAQFVRPEESVERAVSLVATRLATPVATNLTVHGDGGVQLRGMLPAGPIDLFAGQDAVILARYTGSGHGTVRIEGTRGETPVVWTRTVEWPERERANAFVPRLWATQRIGYLSAERHAHGPSSDTDTELRTLGETYGIPTELTSYLVQEPQVAMNAVPSPPRVLRQLTTRAMPVGAAAQFDAAALASKQRAAVSLAAAPTMRVAADSAVGPSIEQVGGRAFVHQGDAWVDARYHEPYAGRVVRVRPYSAAYFAVLDAAPVVAPWLALGDTVVVVGRGVVVRVEADGDETLRADAVAAVRAGW